MTLKRRERDLKVTFSLRVHDKHKCIRTTKKHLEGTDKPLFFKNIKLQGIQVDRLLISNKINLIRRTKLIHKVD